MARGTRKTAAASRLEKAAGGRRAAARAMTGVAAKGKLPPKGSSERRAYDSAMRALQRASKVPGQINPATGKAYEARPGRQRIERAQETIARRKRLRRQKAVTVTLTANVQINRDPRYTRRRTFPPITLSGRGYQALVDRNEAALERMAEYLGDVSGLATAPGIAALDISGIEIIDAQAGDEDELGDE